MNKYALVLLGLMWVYFFYVRSRSVKILEISQQGEEVEISQGDNKLIAGQSPEFTINLRVFGYNENESHDDIGLLGMITHFFIATPLEANEKIFDQYLCERKSLEQASMIQVIANDAKLRNKVRKLEESDKSQKCAEITGTTLYVRKYFVKGEEYPVEWQMTGPFKNDPYKVVLLTEIEDIPCRQ